MIAVVFALVLFGQNPPTAVQHDSAQWEYDEVDRIAGPVTLFLVCLDGQPTSACVRVPTSEGIVSAPGEQRFTWKFPPLVAGPHTVTVQACTEGAAACSDGASLRFTFVALVNPKNLRLGGGR